MSADGRRPPRCRRSRRGSGGGVCRTLRAMRSDEIRELFLGFFAERDHLRIPSGSLVPAEHDPSVLLTTAGMHPLKPYFQGREKPPHHRLASCQKCFRTPDIDQVGLTTRHLTFFEMLGNFSLGDYFKQGAVEMAWELSLKGFGFEPEKIWITVFEGDDELGIGPDEEAIEAWLSVGVPRERIVLLPALGELLAGGPDRAVRAVQRALPRPRARVRQGRRPARRRERALPRVLEPRLHAVQPGPGRDADAAAGAEHRHRARPQPPRRDPAGHALGVRDRPVHAADRARRAAVGTALRRRRGHRPRAAHPRRPHARDELPRRRRRRADQRGPRLRAAQGHAPRDPPGPPHRHRGRLPAALRRAGARPDGPRVPGADRAARVDPDLRWPARRSPSAARSTAGCGCSTR